MSINKLQKSKPRRSNLEAVRILAMGMIVIHHFISHAIGIGCIKQVYLVINPFVYGGVNLFFLISGYFLVRFSLKNLARLIFIVAFFGLINIIPFAIFPIGPNPSSIIRRMFFPIAYSSYWFLQIYLALMIVSPILNIGLKSLSNRVLLEFILIFSVFTFYSCFIGRNMTNPDGYSLGQALYLYTLGYCISRNMKNLSKISSQKYFLVAILTIIIISYISSFIQNIRFMEYNSPLMVVASTMILIGFARMDFSSKVVNSIASASLGVYLLQDGYLGFNFLYAWMNEIWYSSHNLGYRVFIYVCVFFGLWIASWMLTNVFNRTFEFIWGKLTVSRRTISLNGSLIFEYKSSKDMKEF